MECASGVYSWTTPSGKKYVGSSLNLKQRRMGHLKDLRSGTHKNRHLQNAFAKYGEQAFIWTVLEHVRAADQLLQAEESWIQRLKSADREHGYNINPTATGGSRSAETRARMSAAQIGIAKGRVLSPEHRAKIAAAGIGRVVSTETRAKIAAARKGMRFSAAHREKLSARKKELCKSPEYKEMVSAMRKGRVVRPETRAKLSVAGYAAWEKRKEAAAHAEGVGNAK